MSNTPRENVVADIRLWCQSDAWPALTGPEIEAVAGKALVVDSVGIRPGATGYTETFNHNRALALGSELKAAKAAGGYDFSSGGQSHKRSQVAAFWKEKAKEYRKLSGSGAGSIGAAGAAAFSPATGDYIGRGGIGAVNASDAEGEPI